MNATGLLRGLCVALLLVNAVAYASLWGIWPALGWTAAAIASARWIPSE